MLIELVALIAAYLLGSLSGSLLLGRVVGIDIRTRGSGNAGGTNAFRTLGWKFALGVVAIDVGKGCVAAWLGLQLGRGALLPTADALGYACALAAAIGHTWPVFFGFRGGKGAGTLAGGVLVLWPLAIAPLLGVWLLLLTTTGYVGLSTVCAALALVPLAWLAPEPTAARHAFAIAAAAFIVYTHRVNLQRLRTGSEHRFERVRVLARLFGR
jgi:glycerol-3-phosphate acyltransferase PlsY